MHKKGFFLIEFLVYLIGISLFLAFAARISVNGVMQTIVQKKNCQQIAAIHATMQRFIRDIHEAPSLARLWIYTNPEKILWRSPNSFIGWELQKNSLVRYEGDFDIQKEHWIKKTKSVAAKNVHSVAFVIDAIDDVIRGINLTLACAENNQIAWYVSLRNREL